MSIWGKVIGGVAGFALGGPLAALLGAAAGHAVDRFRAREASERSEAATAREIAFTVAVIALGAKMAKADGRVSRVEVDAFKRAFYTPPDEMKAVGRLFDEARASAEGFEPYARQAAELFRQEPAILEELLAALHEIACSDGPANADEIAYLRQVAEIFGLSRQTFERVRAEMAPPGEGDPYAALGLKRTAPAAEIKRTYRRLVRENHPDTLIAKGMPKEFVELANRKLAAINGAYDRIAKERGIK